MQFQDRGVTDVRPQDAIYLTNRCRACGRFITKLEILQKFKDQQEGLCPCGSRSIKPANPKWWEEFFTLRSWKLYFAMRRGEVKQSEDAEVE